MPEGFAAKRYNGIDSALIEAINSNAVGCSQDGNKYAISHENLKAIEKLYNTNGLFRKIINMPARDATNKNIIIHNEKNKEILAELNKKKYRNHLEKAIRVARLYGSALILLDIKTDHNNKYENEVKSNDKIENFSIKYIFNPSEFCIDSSNENYPLDWDYYRISSNNLSLTIHKSRAILITFQELQEKADDLFSGSMFLHLLNDITRYEDALEIETNLMIQSQYDILQIKTEENKTPEEIQKQTKEILRQNQYAKATLGTQLIGIDDKISRIQSIFTGYSEVTNDFKDKICASASIPKMFLFGETVNGLSNESNTTLSDYYSNIEGLQEDCLRLAYSKLIELVCRKNNYEMNDYSDFEFAKLWQLDDIEKSNIFLNYANACTKYLADDVLTKEEIRQILEENKILNLEAKTQEKQKNTEQEGLEVY